MEKTNLIIGGIANYNFEQLKPWILSINEVCDSSVEKVLLYKNISQETLSEIEKHGFEIYPLSDANLPIHVLRFIGIYDYLKERKHIQYVVTTDVKDVYFQKNPFNYINDIKYLIERDNNSEFLISSSEGMKYKDEPWGRENFLQTYGPFIYEEYKEKIIQNVGVLAGSSNYIRDLCLSIVVNGINRPIPIVDQAVYNFMIHSVPYRENTFFTTHNQNWACQAGTMVDPSKIESFRSFLLDPEPIFKDGKVMNYDYDSFHIVHQYDRVPEWKKFVYEKYDVESQENMFVYRS